MNVKLLRKVKNYILAEPKRLRMWGYVLRKGKNEAVPLANENKYRPFAKCGTAACIAGWTCLLQLKPKQMKGFNYDFGFKYYNNASKLLDLTNDQSQRLFMPDMWPREFRGGTTDDGKPETAKIAAARIEHFIQTEGSK